MPKQNIEQNIYIEARYDHTLFGQGTPILGLTSLFDEMQKQGYSIAQILDGTGIAHDALTSATTTISQYQKLKLFQNIQSLSKDPLIGLRAGQKQKLSDFGVYGYALYSSRNFQQAVELGIRHIKLASPVLQKSFYIQNDTAIFEAKEIIALGHLLPLICELASLKRVYPCISGILAKINSSSASKITPIFFTFASIDTDINENDD